MLLTATLCLLALGAVMVFSASSTTKVLSDGGLSDSAFYLKRTLMFGALGLLVMHLVASFDLAAIRRLTGPFLLLSFFLLLVVLVAGTSVNGSSRWIGSGFLQIQPSEIAKVALVLYAADLLAAQAEAGQIDRGADALPAGRRRGLAADRRSSPTSAPRWSSPSPPARPWSPPGRG